MKFIKITFLIFSLKIFSQTSGWEITTKPIAYLINHYELSVGYQHNKSVFSVYGEYRPRLASTGPVSVGGSGFLGFYDQPYSNPLYKSYGIGLRCKRYFYQAFYYGLEMYYRNWNFEKIYNEYSNVESIRMNFDGVRSENVNVFGSKLLIGYSLVLFPKWNNGSPFFDVYLGMGIRRRKITYETFKGTVQGQYYDYLRELSVKTPFTPQFGISVGMKINRKKS